MVHTGRKRAQQDKTVNSDMVRKYSFRMRQSCGKDNAGGQWTSVKLATEEELCRPDHNARDNSVTRSFRGRIKLL